MERVFDGGSYHFDASALPFLVAAFEFLVMMAYAVLMRGPPLLRASFLGVCATVLPFLIGAALMASTDDLDVAAAVFRLALAPTTLAGACVFVFDLTLARELARHWRAAAAVLGASVVMAALCATTDLVIDGAYITPSGIPFGTAGPLAAVHVGLVGVGVAAGGVFLWRHVDSEASPARRRQVRGAMWAFSICGLGVIDLLLTYRIGYYPTSWFFLTLGALIAFRSLVADDLIHAAAVDRGAAVPLLYAAAALAIAWWIVSSGETSAVAVTGASVGAFLALRAAFALGGFLSAGGGAGDSPLDRALDRYAIAAKNARTVEEVATSTVELLQIAVGAEDLVFLVPSPTDYSWRDPRGVEVPEAATPDPRLLSWFLEHPRPVVRDQIVAARLGELREPLERLFDSHAAEALVPLATRDEVVGLVCLSALPGGRALRPDERALLERAAELTTAGVVYANMYRETTERVEIAKEVELAAAVQEAFVPGPDVERLGAVSVTGIYAPASRCGGDWWSARQLSNGRVLLLIGDVTGHGVAAAMVTAAAKGCCDVALRLMGDDVDVVELLHLLHGAVRRTGGEAFHMTCFATLLDPAAESVTFANAGHVVPYVLRETGGNQSLDVLVARGNPLGSDKAAAEYRAHTRPIQRGDVLVWYTDGIVECTNSDGKPFGDRRFQRAIKRAASSGAGVGDMRDAVVRQTVSHLDGHPPADDITLVFARIGDPVS